MQVASDRRADKKHKRLKDTIKAMPYLLPNSNINNYIYYYSYSLHCSNSIY